jgi:anti-sigma factor RsiW
MTNEDLHELAAGYALGALDANDRNAFEEHLVGCERCRTELAGLREAGGMLAYAVEGHAPPQALRERILVAARAEPPRVVVLRARRTRLYAGAALAAAACAALAIGLWTGLSGGGPSRKLAVELKPSGLPTVAVSGLAAAPAGKIYEIWVIEAGKRPAPAGRFKGGEGTVRTVLLRPVRPGSTVAITLERAPGARTPTPPILVQTSV